MQCFQDNAKAGFTADQFKQSINSLLNILGDSTPSAALPGGQDSAPTSAPK